MTDEHEHAMKVWWEALQAGQQDWPKPIDDRAAAAVIAADRAGLVARIAELKSEVEVLSDNGCHLDALCKQQEAENARLRLNVRGWVEWHRRCDADDDCTYLNDNAWCDAEALASTGIGLLVRAALKDTRND